MKRCRFIGGLLFLAALAACPVSAQNAPGQAGQPIAQASTENKPDAVLAEPSDVGLATASVGANPSKCTGGFWDRWFARVTKTQAEQPHWITPLATVTPRLEEEFRYDIAWQHSNSGVLGENYGFSKGVELIPAERVELIVSPPPYIVHNQPGVQDGFGDVSFLLKYRAFAGNEQHGNYILTFFFGASAPTGQAKNGAADAIVTPTVAFGKGWRAFDVQSTFGAMLPAGDTAVIGRTLAWNTAVQYRIRRIFWPEVEANTSFFLGGPNDGEKQTFLTPGLVIGRIQLWHRLGLTLGGGVQIAVTQFHRSNHNWILSVRFPF